MLMLNQSFLSYSQLQSSAPALGDWGISAQIHSLWSELAWNFFTAGRASLSLTEVANGVTHNCLSLGTEALEKPHWLFNQGRTLCSPFCVATTWTQKSFGWEQAHQLEPSPLLFPSFGYLPVFTYSSSQGWVQSPPHQSQLLTPERLQERQVQPNCETGTLPEHGLRPSIRSRSGP